MRAVYRIPRLYAAKVSFVRCKGIVCTLQWHRCVDGFVCHQAVRVIAPEQHRNLPHLQALGAPVARNIWDVLQIKSGHSWWFQVLKRANSRQM